MEERHFGMKTQMFLQIAYNVGLQLHTTLSGTILRKGPVTGNHSPKDLRILKQEETSTERENKMLMKYKVIIN